MAKNRPYRYLYRPQMKFAKVMFLHLSVSHSVTGGGVCLSACWDIYQPLSMQINNGCLYTCLSVILFTGGVLPQCMRGNPPPPPPGADTPQGPDTPLPQCMLGDTVNKWAHDLYNCTNPSVMSALCPSGSAAVLQYH